MIARVKELFAKHKEVILYVIFGGLTTVVDTVVRFSCYYLFASAMEQYPLLLHVFDVAAWAAAVLFAFITNRIWVFESKKKGFLPILGELASFAGGRVLTLGIQEAFMFLFCTVLHYNKYLFTVIVAVIVVILNYFISKLLVFRKKK